MIKVTVSQRVGKMLLDSEEEKLTPVEGNVLEFEVNLLKSVDEEGRDVVRSRVHAEWKSLECRIVSVLNYHSG